MSVQSEISRLKTAKADIAEAIQNHGVEVSSTLSLDGYAAKINEIVSKPFTGATETADGTIGLVPQPTKGQENYVLKGNGKWSANDIFVVDVADTVPSVTLTQAKSAIGQNKIVILNRKTSDDQMYYFVSRTYVDKIRFVGYRAIYENCENPYYADWSEENSITFTTYSVGSVVSGGTTGQVLAKKSDDNYDVEWKDFSGGNTIVVDAVYKGTTKASISSPSITYEEAYNAALQGKNIVLKTSSNGTSKVVYYYFLNRINKNDTLANSSLVFNFEITSNNNYGAFYQYTLTWTTTGFKTSYTTNRVLPTPTGNNKVLMSSSSNSVSWSDVPGIFLVTVDSSSNMSMTLADIKKKVDNGSTPVLKLSNGELLWFSYEMANGGLYFSAITDDGNANDITIRAGEVGPTGKLEISYITHYGIPGIGTTGYILAKANNTGAGTNNGYTKWIPVPHDIPTGGTDGQILAKDGTTDYATKWIDEPESKEEVCIVKLTNSNGTYTADKTFAQLQTAYQNNQVIIAIDDYRVFQLNGYYESYFGFYTLSDSDLYAVAFIRSDETVVIRDNDFNKVPSGGTTNQILAKSSNDDYELKWVDAPTSTSVKIVRW